MSQPLERSGVRQAPAGNERNRGRTWLAAWVLHWSVVATGVWPLPAPAAVAADGTAAAAPLRPIPRHRSPETLDGRVRLLARELDLDAAQQVAVRKLLEAQREQILEVWDDVSVPPARRVVATQAIADRTADAIRALLNEEQKKKYPQPQDRNARADTARPDVESFMYPDKSR